MRKTAGILFLTALVLLCSCSGRNGSRFKGKNLFVAVPADAVAFMYTEQPADAFPQLFDCDRFPRNLELGPYAGSKAVLSYIYSGGLVPVLCIQLDRNDDTSSENVRYLRDEASRMKVAVDFYFDDSPFYRPVAVLSPSSGALGSVRKHLESGTSILGNEEALRAIAAAGQRSEFLVFSNRDFPKMVHSAGELDAVCGGNLRETVADLADWTTIVWQKNMRYQAWTVQQQDPGYYMNLLNDIQPAQSRLGDILPADCEFVESLQIASVDKFIAACEPYQDAHSLLSVGGRRRQNAIEWARALNIKEIALVQWRGRRLILIRPAKFQNTHDTMDNPYAGYPELIFGELFSLKDESASFSAGDWLVWGSSEDAEEFIENRSGTVELPSRKTKGLVLFNLEGRSVLFEIAEDNGIKYGISVSQ
ncbi:MAG: hypothetical protein MJY42_01805 [Bacteroidales bacterium]|nr:hypothetical protein [Bacteroidales bacterium]